MGPPAAVVASVALLCVVCCVPSLVTATDFAEKLHVFAVAPTRLSTSDELEVLCGVWVNKTEMISVTSFTGSLTALSGSSGGGRLPTVSVKREVTSHHIPKSFAYALKPDVAAGDYSLHMVVHFSDRYGQVGSRSFFHTDIQVSDDNDGPDAFIVSSPPSVMDPPAIRRGEVPFPHRPFLILDKRVIGDGPPGVERTIEYRIFNAGFVAARSVTLHDRIDWGSYTIVRASVPGGVLDFRGKTLREVLKRPHMDPLDVDLKFQTVLEAQDWLVARIAVVPHSHGAIPNRPARLQYKLSAGQPQSWSVDSPSHHSSVVPAATPGQRRWEL